MCPCVLARTSSSGARSAVAAVNRPVARVERMIMHPPRSHRSFDPERWADLIAGCPLFEGLDAETLGALVRAAHQRVATSGEFFFLEGDPPNEVYMLVHGRVRLIRSGAQGRELIVGLVSAAELFGYVAAWAGSVHRVAAQAAEASRTIWWDTATLTRLAFGFPTTARAGLRLMAQRLEREWDQLQDLSTRRIECRIARTLLRLGQRTAPSAAAERAIAIDLRQQDLAALVGATPFTINRILSAWRRSGLADVKRAHICVQKPGRLWEIVAADDEPDGIQGPVDSVMS